MKVKDVTVSAKAVRNSLALELGFTPDQIQTVMDALASLITTTIANGASIHFANLGIFYYHASQRVVFQPSSRFETKRAKYNKTPKDKPVTETPLVKTYPELQGALLRYLLLDFPFGRDFKYHPTEISFSYEQVAQSINRYLDDSDNLKAQQAFKQLWASYDKRKAVYQENLPYWNEAVSCILFNMLFTDFIKL